MFSQILKRSLALCSALTMALLVCNTSHAGVLLKYSSSPNPILQGGSGTIDVSLTNNDAVDSPDIASFFFTLEASPLSGITFTDLDFPVSDYIYSGGSSYVLNTPGETLLVGSTGLSSISAQDLWDLAPGAGRILAAGETVFLARIKFSVASNATAGSYALSFNAQDTSLLSFLPPIDFEPIPFDTETPNIIIQQSVNAVPEPASVLVFLTLTGLVAAKRRRAQKQS